MKTPVSIILDAINTLYDTQVALKSLLEQELTDEQVVAVRAVQWRTTEALSVANTILATLLGFPS